MPWSTVRALWRAWLIAAGLLLTICAGMSAQAGLRALQGHSTHDIIIPPPATSYAAVDRFPGATVLPATGETAAPAVGVTGTIALPDMPVPDVAAFNPATMGTTGVVPARTFSFGHASALDKGRALECLTAAVYYEAASEPDAGQQAVAQVVLNRVRHPAFPGTVCGVVYQGSERRGCQFSFACDGAMARVPSRSGWAHAAQVAAMALAGRVYAPVGLATHYHTYAVTPIWNRSLVMTDVVGAHFFHRWKGWWGTPDAFHQVYLGGEPVPGPHAPIVVTPLLLSPLAIVATSLLPLVAPAPVNPQTSIKPAYQGSGAPVVATPVPTPAPVATSTDRLPAGATIRPEFANSGTLR